MQKNTLILLNSSNMNSDIYENEASKQIIYEMVVKYGATIMVEPNVIINENIAFLMRVTVSSHFGSQFTVTSDHSFGYVLIKQAS